jgi:hypothetical protein
MFEHYISLCSSERLSSSEEIQLELEAKLQQFLLADWVPPVCESF